MTRTIDDRMARLARRAVLMTYWLQIPLFFGLVLTLLIFGLTFFHGILVAVTSGEIFDRHLAILLVLDLLDMIFIANLISMVLVSGYNTYYAAHSEETADGPISEHDGFGAMKPRIAATIVIISSIHLLHEILGKNVGDWRHLAVLTLVHLILLATAAALILLRRPPQ